MLQQITSATKNQAGLIYYTDQYSYFINYYYRPRYGYLLPTTKIQTVQKQKKLNREFFKTMDRPAFFETKKWILVVVCAIYIVLEIILAAFSSTIANNWIEQHGGSLKTHNDIELEKVSSRF